MLDRFCSPDPVGPRSAWPGRDGRGTPGVPGRSMPWRTVGAACGGPGRVPGSGVAVRCDAAQAVRARRPRIGPGPTADGPPGPEPAPSGGGHLRRLLGWIHAALIVLLALVTALAATRTMTLRFGARPGAARTALLEGSLQPLRHRGDDRLRELQRREQAVTRPDRQHSAGAHPARPRSGIISRHPMTTHALW